MRLRELEILVDATVEVRRSGGRFVASFPTGETKEHAGSLFLAATYGQGRTAAQARADYAQQLRGKRLILDATRIGRREFTIPDTLRS